MFVAMIWSPLEELYQQHLTQHHDKSVNMLYHRNDLVSTLDYVVGHTDIVWEVRVDIKVLNHSGNILDACSLAAITALAHFKRPDVSVDDGKITIHPADEKAYIPLSVHHMPICTSYSFYHSGSHLLLDASYDEERISEGQMVIAMNKHREICALHMSGTHLLHKDQISRCTNLTASRVLLLTELIQRALENDKQSRDQGEGPGSAELNTYDKVNALSKMAKNMKLRPDVEKAESSEEEEEPMMSEQEEEGGASDEEEEQGQETRGNKSVDIGSGGLSSWNIDTEDMPADQSAETEIVSEQTKILQQQSTKGRRRGKKKKRAAAQSDSEEEETVTMKSADM